MSNILLTDNNYKNVSTISRLISKEINFFELSSVYGDDQTSATASTFTLQANEFITGIYLQQILQFSDNNAQNDLTFNIIDYNTGNPLLSENVLLEQTYNDLDVITLTGITTTMNNISSPRILSLLFNSSSVVNLVSGDIILYFKIDKLVPDTTQYEIIKASNLDFTGYTTMPVGDNIYNYNFNNCINILYTGDTLDTIYKNAYILSPTFEDINGSSLFIMLELTTNVFGTILIGGGGKCPFVYIKSNNEWIKYDEILKNQVGIDMNRDDYLDILVECIEDKIFTIKISEEKDEITYLNNLCLKVGNDIIKSNISNLILNKGDEIEVTFELPIDYVNKKITLIANGYYNLL